MQASLALFRFAAKAALGCAGFGVAGEFVAEVLPDMARTLYQRWAAGRPAAEVHAEVHAAARLGDDEARQLALLAADEAGPDAPPDIHLSLVTYLARIPATIRQTHRCTDSLVIASPADVLKILPARLPRFAKGQRARGFPDWTLDELLGIGGFGEVWKATNPHLPPVALKFCLDEAAARFLRHEADLLGRLVRQGRHPGVVALLDTALSTDPPCLKYEFVPGGDLAALARDRRGPARPLVRQLAEAVAFAHRLDPPVVHRDLKPANVLVQHDHDGEVVLQVADFGIGAIVSARSLGPAAARAPTALSAACTPLYASPQQLRGEEPSPGDDVFALGVLWYQLLAGDFDERPGADWREALAGSGVGRDEIDLLGRCLAGRADRRPRDAGALVDALDALEGPAEGPAVGAEDETDTDDALDLADRLQRSLAEAQRALALARDLAEKRHDYAGAVRRLEGVPSGFRDSALLEVYRDRRDRVSALRREIFPAARRGDFAGLHERIADLLALTPGDEKVRRLLEVVPYRPGPEVVNALGMRLVLVPDGAFAMGSPHGEIGRQSYEGVRPVTIARPFYLGAYPVTQEQFERVMGTNPAHFRHVSGQDTRSFPVENVTWHDADEFCRRLAALPAEGERGRRYRLPSEAEWEYACRAGGDPSHPFSAGRSLSSAQANFDGRRPYGHATFGPFRGRTTKVGAFVANAWGLFDMHGNVWEWCADRFADAGEARVMRGGSWQNHAASCRSASRDWIGPGYRGCTVGFRVVLEVAEGG